MTKLERAFRAAIVSASAVGCGEVATAPDAGRDATADTSGDVLDAALWNLSDAYWCDAGRPIPIKTCGSCCGIVQEQCEIPPSEIADDAGSLWLCDDYCIGPNWQGCRIVELDGATSSLPYVMCGCTGRRYAGYCTRRWRTVGEWFASIAGLEAASIHAFRRLKDELEALDAPAKLAQSAKRAMCDEARHTRTIARIAKRLGAPVTLPRPRRFRKRSTEAIAIENAVEGCVREMFGALVGLWQAEHAREERVRRAMRAIARDEMRHAALAFKVAAFLDSRIDPAARQRVARARAGAIRELRASLSHQTPHELVEVAGLPTREQATALFHALAL